tara:strand:+ start:1260 stop:1970 length:711 start_codon:yes stop_codon:yes gene_type:complete
MKDKEFIQEEEYTFPYHHILKRNEHSGISYFSVINIIKKILKEIESKNLLDFGCGDGRLVRELRNTGVNITGIDISGRAISFARVFSPTSKFISKDISKYKPNSKFDTITSIEVLEHITPLELKNTINSIHRLLKKDGHLVITVPSDNISTSKKHYQHFNVSSMKKELEGKFKIIKALGHYKLSKPYELFYALSINNYISITSKHYQKFLNFYFKKRLEKCSVSKCRRLIFICKKI